MKKKLNPIQDIDFLISNYNNFNEESKHQILAIFTYHYGLYTSSRREAISVILMNELLNNRCPKELEEDVESILKNPIQHSKVPTEGDIARKFKEAYQQHRNIYYIPKKYRTKQICLDHVERGGTLEPVPSKYRLKKVVSAYYKHHHNVEGIPSKYITKEMALEHIKNGGSLISLPSRVKTEELYKYYALINHSLEIPVDYLDEDIYLDYIKHGGLLGRIPSKALCEEIYKAHFELNNDITAIPKQYIDEEMCVHYIQNGGELELMPDEFKNETIVNMYIIYNKRPVYSSIPIELRTNKTKELYFSKYYRTYAISAQESDDETQMANNIFEHLLTDKQIPIDTVFNYIPDECITTTMIKQYLKIKKAENERHGIKHSTFLQTFYNKIFSRTKNINLIEEQYRTSFMRSLTVFAEEKKKTKEEKRLEEKCQKIREQLLETNLTRKEISQNNHVDIELVEQVMQMIQQTNEKEYLQILKNQLINEHAFHRNAIFNLKKIKIIAQSLGEFEYDRHKITFMRNANTKLNQKQKLYLSYLIGKCDIPLEQFHQAYNALSDEQIVTELGFDEQDVKNLNRFFNALYQKTNLEHCQTEPFNDRFSVITNKYLKFLREADKEEIMQRKICQDDKVKALTDEEYEEIIEILKEQDVPLTHIIVKEAAWLKLKQEDLKPFINDLKSNDEIVEQAKVQRLELPLETKPAKVKNAKVKIKTYQMKTDK